MPKTLTGFNPAFYHVNIWDLSVNFAIYTSQKPNISICTPIIKKLGPYRHGP